MNREEFYYLIPYVVSFAITFGVFLYSWNHRRVRGADIYTWFVGGQTLTILGFIFEMVSPGLQTKLMWDRFQWLTDSFLVFIPFLIFAVQFSEYKLKHPRLAWGYWCAFPIIFTLLLLTDNIHHLIYTNPHLSTAHPFPELQYDFTAVVYAYALFYVYGANLFGIGLLIRRAIQTNKPYRLQYLTVAFGFLIPLALSFFALANIKIMPERDLAPFSFAVGNLVVAWGLFRYGLFNVLPIGRERIIENMSDPVIVLDSSNRVVDINSAALTTIGKTFSGVIGAPATSVLDQWPDIIEMLERSHEHSKEISVKTQDDRLFYDINISPIIINRERELIGNVIVARDITRQKTLEVSYRFLSTELDQRVKERTEELRKSAERYRTVIENQTEFIVRYKPDGTRTFVNDAYCRYFGISPQNALSSNFMPLVVEEDRHIVEQKLVRLVSGKTKVETEVHRVIKPDGNIGWQEWTDQVIQNETGEVVEIQAVGRDITERKRAEDRILRLNRLYATISQINQTIVHERDRETLFKEICRVAIEFGQFRMAWIGAVDEVEKRVKPMVFAGAEQGYLSKVDVRYLDASLGQGPTGSAVREGRCVICQDIASDPHMAPWRDLALERGFRSSAAVPFRERGRVVGALTVYASEPQGFDEEDEKLIDEIGLDISYALDSINAELERKQAEEALLQESGLNAKMAMDLQSAYDSTLEGWSHALDLRDKETEGHTQRVTELTLHLARKFGLSEDDLLQIKRGGLLHDIGKMGVPDSILLKPGPLTEEEWNVMRKHPVYAYEMLSRIEYLQSALVIPYYHHEKWDGSGYPQGLARDEIPLIARIFAVIDVWDALSSDRPYRRAWDKDKVIEYLQDESGKHFDPKVVTVFLELLSEGRI